VRAIDARKLLAAATAQLEAGGVESARFDAESLLAFVLGVDRGRLLIVGDFAVGQVAAFQALIERRSAREPLQYLTGEAPFRHIVLAVGPGVFIPRPETELLVDAALPDLRTITRPRVVDLCSGSGALALAIADEVPSAEVYAVEQSPPALLYLRRNAGDRVTVVESDIADPALLASAAGTVDVVVCNPPYVPTAVLVSPEVLRDPGKAVFSGAAGLDLMPIVIAAAARLLRTGGLVIIEHDDTQGESVPALLREDGRWVDVMDHLDLTGRARFVTARRSR
jgi:release factor glutamine methyltransferase